MLSLCAGTCPGILTSSIIDAGCVSGLISALCDPEKGLFVTISLPNPFIARAPGSLPVCLRITELLAQMLVSQDKYFIRFDMAVMILCVKLYVFLKQNLGRSRY